MESISASFFFEHSLAIHFAVAVLAAALCFAAAKLTTVIAYISKSVAAKLRSASLESGRSVGRIAVTQ